MARFFDVQIISGTAPGPYTIYYDTINVSNIVTLTNSGNPATNVSFSSLSLGVNVTIPDNTTSIILFNEQCSIDETFIVPTSTPTPTPTSTPTPTPTATNTPTPTPTATNTPTPTPTPNCEFDIIVNNDTTPTPTPTPTNTPTPTPTPTNTETPTPTPTSTNTPTPTPTATNTPTPTPTPICEFDFDLLVNYSPTDISLTNNSINENNSINTIIGSLSTVTLDTSDTHTYSIVGGSSNFNISGNDLRASVVFSYESATSYNITIRTTDSVGQSYDKLFTIFINNVNEAPYGLTFSGSIYENQSIGTSVGSIGSLDSDSSDTFTYQLIDTSSYPDNGSFSLSSGGSLTSAVIFNYESKNSYSIRVRTTDAGGLTYDGTLTVPILNLNESPTNISLSSSSISENVPTGTTIGTLSATDPDAGDTFTFSLVDNATYPDNSNFYIDGTTLKSNTIFNFESKNSYSIRVRVTDAGGLTFDKTITITITNVTIVVTASATTNVTCNGGNNGVITVSNATGGTAAYTYSRDGVNYQVGTTFSSLTAGPYTIYAKDSYGEVGTTSVTVTQPAAITFSTTNTSPTCNGGTDGSIVVSGASGGSGTFTYSRDGSNYQSSTTFSNLPSGSYTIYVKDSNNCVETTSVTLSRTAVTATVTQTNLTCFNSGNGVISITNVSGGQGGPYSTKLNVGGTYQVISTTRNYTSLSAGTYTVFVKDTVGCEVTYSITITQPTAVAASATGTNPTCYNGSNGSIVVSGSGGSGTYTYSIDGTNYQSSTTFSSLTNGSYTLYVRDSANCVSTTSVTLNRTAPNATITPNSVACNGGTTGSISVSSFTGGSGPYRVSIDGVNYTSNLTSHTFSNLSAGTYTIYVRDNSDCTQSYSSTVSQPTAVSISVDSTTAPTCYNGSNGSIVVSGSGGTSPYTYSKDGTNYQASGTFSSLSVGTYTIYVKDTNGCITSTSRTLSKSAPSATISATNPSCSTGTGTITVSSGSGGSGSGYQAKNGLGGTYTNLPATFSGLGGGSYIIYVRDGAGCEVTDSRTITIPTAVTVTLTSSTPPTCYNGGDGSISFSASGGNGSHQFRLNGGTWQPSGIFTGLSVGTYTIQTRDTNGCESSTTNVTLTKSAPTASVSQTNVSCNGGSNGTITVSSPSGGSGSSYTYSRDGVNYQSSGTFSSLSAGSYDIYVRDGANCVSYLTTITITQPSTQTSTITVNTFATCNGGADGAITLSSSGGTFPKTYRLYADTSAPYTTCGGDLIGTYSNVSSGSPSVSVTGIDEYGYCLQVTDNNGCIVESGVVETTNCSGTCYTITLPQSTLTFNGESLYINYTKTNGTFVSRPYSDFPAEFSANNDYITNICSTFSPSYQYGASGDGFLDPGVGITINGKCDDSQWCGGADPYVPPTGGGGGGGGGTTYSCKSSPGGECSLYNSPCSSLGLLDCGGLEEIQ